MANVCCDDIYFYSKSDSGSLDALWEDLETSIIFCPDENLAAIENLFLLKEIPTDGLSLRGTVIYMERNEENILLSVSAAWSPLYDAYNAIAEAYRLSFVMQSIEPGCEIYINTDHSGTCFPHEYTVSVEDEDYTTPTGIPVKEKLECGESFSSDPELFQCFAQLGYKAETIEELNILLEDAGITIHTFTDPYSDHNSPDWREIA